MQKTTAGQRAKGLAVREAGRRYAWLARKLESEAAAMAAPSFEWKPTRPRR